MAVVFLGVVSSFACSRGSEPPPFKPVAGDVYEACSHCHRKYVDAIVNANK